MQKSRCVKIFASLLDALESHTAFDPRGKPISQEQISAALADLKFARAKYRSVLRERSKITEEATKSFISAI